MRRFSLKKCWKTSRLLDDSGRSRKGHWCQKRTRKRSAKAQKTAFFDGTYHAIPSSIPWDFLSERFASQKFRIADLASLFRGLDECSLPRRNCPRRYACHSNTTLATALALPDHC